MRSGIVAFSSMLLLCLFFLFYLRVYDRAYVSVHAEVRPGVFNGGKEETAEVSFFPLDHSEYLVIPLPENVEESGISVTENPYKRLILVSIEGADEGFYRENSFFGDMDGISDLKYGLVDGTFTVELKTDKICIYDSDYEKGRFYIRMIPVRETYEHIIVLDPGHGGSDPGSVVYGIREKDITLGLALALKDRLESGKNAVYLTTDGSSDVSDEDRAEFINDIKPDLVISLHTGADPDTRVHCGVEANASEDLRDRAAFLTLALSEACSEKDLGVSLKHIPGVTDSIYAPYIRLKLGYITNKGDALKMSSEEYRETASGVIAEAVKEILSL